MPNTMTQIQQKQYDHYSRELGIVGEVEKFILLKLLALDWKRNIIIHDIYQIAEHVGTMRVRCRTNVTTYDFTVSDYKSTGFPPDWSEAQRKQYTLNDLYRKVTQ